MNLWPQSFSRAGKPSLTSHRILAILVMSLMLFTNFSGLVYHEDWNVASASAEGSELPESSGSYFDDPLLVHRSIVLEGGKPSQSPGRASRVIEDEPGDRDLASTQEVTVTSDLLSMANELEEAEDIYLFVQSTIDYEPYFGSLKGAQETFFEGAGNDLDQASLLIALYRSQGIPARYVYGSSEIEIDEAMNWLGVEDEETAFDIFQENGIPSSATRDGGDIVSISFDHVWVAAHVDADGAGPKKEEWLQLDPSFKQYVYKDAAPLQPHEENVSLALAGIVGNVSSFENGAVLQFNQLQESSIMAGLGTELLDDFANQTYDYLLDNGLDELDREHLDRSASLASDIEEDRFGSRTIISVSGFSEELPLDSSMVQDHAVLPDSFKHRVVFSAPGFEYNATTSQLVGKRITISYLPSTAEDEEIFNNYRELAKLPAGALQETAFLKVDSVVKAVGEPAKYGSNQTLTITFLDPTGTGFTSDTVSSQLVVGGFYSVGLDLQQIPERLLMERNNRLDATRQLLDLGFESLPHAEELMGELFNLASLYYFYQLDSFATYLGLSSDVVWTRQPSATLIGTSFSRSYQGGVMKTAVPSGLFFDVKRDVMNAYPAKEGGSASLFMERTGYRGSELEHQVLDQVLGSPAVSTQKIFTIAAQRDIPIFTLNSGNFDELSGKVYIPEEAASAIQAAINTGYNVSLPQQAVSLNEWEGTGWLIQDPETGALSPMISGNYAGGESKEKGWWSGLLDINLWDSLVFSTEFAAVEWLKEKVGEAKTNIANGAYNLVKSGYSIYSIYKDNPCDTLANLYESLINHVAIDGGVFYISTVTLGSLVGVQAFLAGAAVAVTASVLKNGVKLLMKEARSECSIVEVMMPKSLDLGIVGETSDSVEHSFQVQLLGFDFVKNADARAHSKNPNIKFKKTTQLFYTEVVNFDLTLEVDKNWKRGKHEERIYVEVNYVTQDDNYKKETKSITISWYYGGYAMLSPNQIKDKTYISPDSGSSKYGFIADTKSFTLTTYLSGDPGDRDLQMRVRLPTGASVKSYLKGKEVGAGSVTDTNWMNMYDITSGKYKDYFTFTDQGDKQTITFTVGYLGAIRAGSPTMQGFLKPGLHSSSATVEILDKGSSEYTLTVRQAFRIPITVRCYNSYDELDREEREKEREDKKGDDERLKKLNGDNPDDTFDVTGAFLSPSNSFDTSLRYAVSRGLTQASKLNDYKTLAGSHLFGDVADEKDAYKRHSAELALRYQDLVDNIQAISTEMEQAPYVALLDTGYSDAMSAYLSHLNEPYVLVDVNFDPEIVKYQPVLVVASGGFYGLDGSAAFKAKLERYAELGGTIIAFTQQYGYEFAPLPGNVDGYGWLQDQRCQHSSVIIDEYTHAFAWSSTTTMSLNADGYFTDYPDNASVLLKRRVNDQAAMISYPWGEGSVIVSDTYPAYNYAYVGTNWAEDAFTRNLLQWAIHPDIGSEPRGEAIKVNVTVSNTGSRDASSIALSLLSPKNEQLHQIIFDEALEVGEETTLEFVYDLGYWYWRAGGGIYTIDYVLLDEDNNTISSGYYAQQFAYSYYEANPDGFVYTQADLLMWATSDEYLLYGAVAEMELHIKNNGESDFTGTVPRIYAALSGPSEVSIPAGETRTFQYTITLTSSWVGRFYLYDGKDTMVAQCLKKVSVTRPAIRMTPRLDYTKSSLPGTQTTLGIELENLANLAVDYQVRTTIITHEIVSYNTIYPGQPNEYTVPVWGYVERWGYEDNYTVHLNASFWPKEMKYDQRNVTIPIPDPVLHRNYIARVEVFVGDSTVPLYTKHLSLRVPWPEMNLSHELVSTRDAEGELRLVYSSANNVIGDLPVTIHSYLSNSALFQETLDITLKDQYLNITVPANDLKESNIYIYGGGNNFLIPVSNRLDVEIEADRSSYRNGESAYYNITLNNTGQFDNHFWVNCSFQETGLQLSREVSLDSGQGAVLMFEVPLFGLEQSWWHQVHFSISNGITTVTGNSDNFRDLTQRLSILPPRVQFSVDKESYNAGDNILLTAENIGGVVALFDIHGGLGYNYYSELPRIRDNISLEAGESQVFQIAVPDTTSTGTYTLVIRSWNEDLQRWDWSFSKRLQIKGVGFDTEFPTEPVRVGEGVNFNLTNTGPISSSVTVNVTLAEPWWRNPNPEIFALESHSLDFTSGEKKHLNLVLPGTLVSKNYILDLVIYEIATGTYFNSSSWLDIKGWDVEAEITKTDLTVEDTLDFWVNNTGGVNTTLDIVATMVSSHGRNTKISETSISLGLDGSKLVKMDIPDSLDTSGTLRLQFEDKGLEKSKLFSFDDVRIRGLAVNMAVQGTVFNASEGLMVELDNIGGKDVNATVTGKLDFQEFTQAGLFLAKGNNDTVILELPGDVATGDYLLSIELRDNDTGRYVCHYLRITVNGLELNVQPERLSHSGNESANVTVNNAGAFGLDVTVNLSLLDGETLEAYGEGSQTLDPDQNISVSLTVPDSLPNGDYTLQVLVNDSVTGESRLYLYTVHITNLRLTVSLSKRSYSSLEDLGLDIRNTGSMDTVSNWTATLREATGQEGLVVSQENGSFSLESGKDTQLGLDIPDQLISGVYLLEFHSEDRDSGALTSEDLLVGITGVDFDFELIMNEENLTGDLLQTTLDIESSLELTDVQIGLEVLTGGENGAGSGKEGWEAMGGTNIVTDIVSDKDSLWFTTDGGILKLENPCDSEEWAWSYFNSGNTPFPVNSFGAALLVDGKLWFGWQLPGEGEEVSQAGGIVIYDTGSGKWALLEMADGFNGGSVMDLALYGDEVWVATRSVNHADLGTIGGGIQVYDITTGDWRSYTKADSGIQDDDQIAGITLTHNTLFVNYITHEFNPDDDILVLSVMNVSDESWAQWDSQNTGMNTNRVLDVEVHGDELWLAHKEERDVGGGISVYDLVQDSWTIYNTTTTPNMLSNSVVDIAFSGDTAWLLFSYRDTVQAFDLGEDTWTNYTGVDDNIPFGLFSIYPCEGYLFGGSGEELFFSGVWHYEIASKESGFRLEGVPGEQYMAMTTIGDEVWLGGWGGIRVLDTTTGKSSKFDTSPLLTNVVDALYYDGDNELWILKKNTGFSIYHLDDESFTYVTTDNSSLRTNSVSALGFNGDEVWLATGANDYTIYLYDRKEDSWQLFDADSTEGFLDGVTVLDFTFSENMVWFTTRDWLGSYNRTSGEWAKHEGRPANHDQEDPLEFANGVVWTFLHHRYAPYNWVLAYFNPENLSWVVPDIEGLGFFQEGQELVSRDGVLYMATVGHGVFELNLDTFELREHNSTTGMMNEDAFMLGFLQSGGFAVVDRYADPGKALQIFWGDGGQPARVVWKNSFLANLSFEERLSRSFTINETGEFRVLVKLHNQLGQLLGQRETTFTLYERKCDISLSSERDSYSENEEFNVTATVFNFGETAANFTVELLEAGELFLTRTIRVQAGSHENVTFTHQDTGNLSFTGRLLGCQKEATLDIAILQPQATLRLDAPAFGGREDFNVTLYMKNTGKLPIAGDIMLEGSPFTYDLASGEEKSFSVSLSITEDRDIKANVTGDIERELEGMVRYGEAVTVTLAPLPYYPVREQNIPSFVNNTGQIPVSLTLQLSLLGPDGYQNQSREVELAVGEALELSSLFTFMEGEQKLTYSSFFGDGEVEFQALPLQQAVVEWKIVDQGAGNFTVEAQVSNTGATPLSAGLGLTASFLDLSLPVSLAVGEDQNFSFIFQALGVHSGDHTLTLELANEDESFFRKNATLKVPQAIFALSQELELEESYLPGDSLNLSFTVSNIGPIDGNAALAVNLSGVDGARDYAWLKIGESRQFNFTLDIAGDISQGDYELVYTLGEARFNQTINISGLRLEVEAKLDRSSYLPGESATLNVKVENLDPSERSFTLYYLVSHGDYNQTLFFELTKENETSFEIPVNFSAGKVLVGVYNELGRSLYLNSLLVREAGQDIVFSTDKESYQAGDTVEIEVTTTKAGTLEISSPQFNNVSSVEAEATQFSFQLDELMRTGGYVFDYQFDNRAYSYPVAVQGYSAKITEFSFDKPRYVPGETISLTFRVTVNRDIDARLESRLVGPGGLSSDSFETMLELKEGENSVTLDYNPTMFSSGLHLVYYQLYLIEESGTRADNDSAELFLIGGQEAFDVAGGSIMSFDLDQAVYSPGEEPVLSIHSYDSAESFLEVYDYVTGEVFYSGLAPEELVLELDSFSGGYHRLIANLTTPAYNSSNQASFDFYVTPNTAPSLTGLVQPVEGYEDTVFRYSVTYIDAENDAPTYVELLLDGETKTMLELDPTDTDMTNGKRYYYDITLGLGTHSYAFRTSDGENVVASTTMPGPVVTVRPDGADVALRVATSSFIVSDTNYLHLPLEIENTGDLADIFVLEPGLGTVLLQARETMTYVANLSLTGYNAGTHNISITAHPESYPGRTASVEVELTLQTDILVTLKSWSPEKPEAGETLSLVVEVRNLGPFDASNFTLDVKIGDLLVTELLVENLAAGAEQTLGANWTIPKDTEGTVELKVSLRDEELDSKLANNADTGTLELESPPSEDEEELPLVLLLGGGMLLLLIVMVVALVLKKKPKPSSAGKESAKEEAEEPQDKPQAQEEESADKAAE